MRYLKSGLKLTDVCEQLFSKADIKATIVVEDPYIHGGVPLAVAEKHGVPGYSQVKGYRDQTIVFGRQRNRNSLPMFSDYNLAKEFMTTPLTDEQVDWTENEMKKRASGEDAVYSYSARTDRSIKNNGDEVAVGMFTNLIWDASLEIGDQDVPFLDVLNWIKSTIDYLSGNADVQLVIKTHPAEKAHGTNQAVSQWIKQQYQPLPRNVNIIEPETNVNTYELIKDLDIGIVYNSTVGFEMAYEGTPVIVAGDTHYRGLGFTIDPDTIVEYNELLEEPDEVVAPERASELARRYAYFLFARKHIEFPFYTTDETTFDFELLPATHNSIKPGNENFDMIVEKMVSGDPIVND
jgi:capsule polysaccharide export protein KpsC/LpsZ